MNNYTKQADDFMKKTGTSFEAEYVGHDIYFDGDKEARDIYRITLERNGEKWSFRFGNSIVNALTDAEKNVMRSAPKMGITYSNKKIPTAYDVLSGLTKYDVGSFSNFCAEFGYDTDSRKAEKIYLSVLDEYKHVMSMFHDAIDELAEIN